MLTTQACQACKDRKRKCDKTLPKCGLCNRFGRKCQYPASSGHCRVATYTPTYSTLIRSNIDETTKSHVSQFIQTATDMQILVHKYFNTVHLWFPVIDEASYRETLSRSMRKSNAETNLVTLCLALITTTPAGCSILETAAGPLYSFVKSAIAVLESIQANSLQLVQSRLLVALFELGHGLESSVYLSLATLARAAASLGINRTHIGRSSGVKTEEFNVWWGIVMLDRYYTLLYGKWPCATEHLGHPHQLPSDPGDFSLPGSLAETLSVDIWTPSDVRVGPFARQAQASHLIQRLLTHFHEPTADQQFNREEDKALERTLDAFSTILPGCNEGIPRPWPKYCGSIGMCYSALMTLHQSQKLNVASQDSATKIQSKLVYLAEMSNMFNDSHNPSDIEAATPFVAHSVHLAMREQHRIDHESGVNGYGNMVLTALQTLLVHLSKRWQGTNAVDEYKMYYAVS